MSGLIKYEWKKIWGSRLTQLSMLGCCLFLVFCVFSSISQITATDLDGNTVNGLEAVNVLKETRPQQTLSQDAITKIMKEYLDYTNNSETSSDKLELKFLSESIYNRFYLPNRELLGLIKNNYKNVNEDADIRQIFNEKIGKDFYQARSKRIRAYLEAKELKGEITYNQFNYWVEQDEKFDSYTYGYCEGWKGIMSTLTWPILIMMIVCIGVSPIFAGEYQSKCDSLILCMRFGKSKLVLSKVLIAWIHASVVYWGISILYSTVFLGVLGTSGGNLPIQIYYPSVPVSYQLTMSQACILALLLGYVLILSSMGITLYLSSVFKNTYGVIIVVFLMLIIPTFLAVDKGTYMWRHFLSLLQSKIADFSYETYTAYTLGKTVFNWLKMSIIVNFAIAAVCSIIAYCIFRRHQVNK